MLRQKSGDHYLWTREYLKGGYFVFIFMIKISWISSINTPLSPAVLFFSYQQQSIEFPSKPTSNQVSIFKTSVFKPTKPSKCSSPPSSWAPLLSSALLPWLFPPRTSRPAPLARSAISGVPVMLRAALLYASFGFSNKSPFSRSHKYSSALPRVRATTAATATTTGEQSFFLGLR